MLSSFSINDIIVIFLAILISMSFHEAMHAFTAHWLGDTTAKDAGRLTLNPLKHIDPFTTVLLPAISLILFHVPFLAAKPVPFNPNRVKYGEFGAALVGIAGPVTNLVLAALVAIFIRLSGISPDSTIYNYTYILLAINVGLFVFNMIPFPPLDGSRLLYAVAPEPLQEIMAKIESLGFTAIIIFMLVFFSLLSQTILNIDTGIINFLLN